MSIKNHDHLHNHTIGDELVKAGVDFGRAKNYPKMVECYLSAIYNYNNSDAMTNLGAHYYKVKNYSVMLHWFNLAKDHDNSVAMYNLAVYYGNKKMYSKMIEYYKMAIKRGNYDAMLNLGLYYKRIQNLPEMMYCFDLAMEYDCVDAMINFGNYYEETKNYSRMIQCFLKANDVEEKDICSINDVLIRNAIDNDAHYLELCKRYLNEDNLNKYNELHVGMKKRECYICYEENYHVELVCRHSVCQECYNKITKCPFCRHEI